MPPDPPPAPAPFDITPVVDAIQAQLVAALPIILAVAGGLLALTVVITLAERFLADDVDRSDWTAYDHGLEAEIEALNEEAAADAEARL